MRIRFFRAALVLGALATGVGLVAGCRISSADSVTRDVGIRVAGLYRNEGARIVSQNSGAPITRLQLIQDGSRLQAIDNNGMIFHGHIGSASVGDGGAQSASFSLDGETTVGAQGIISGTFSVSGTTATMQGTWVEPSRFGSVFAQATGVMPQPDPEPDPEPDPDPDPAPANTSANGGVGTNLPPTP